VRKLLLLLSVLVLSGCGTHLTSGEVMEKHYDPAYSYIWLMPIPHTSCSGSPSVCTTTYTYIPTTQYVPDRWTVKVRNCKVAEECKEDTWRIPESWYNTLQPGQWIDKPE
jgi:hypothetical protein